jgi:hypothetical protein
VDGVSIQIVKLIKVKRVAFVRNNIKQESFVTSLSCTCVKLWFAFDKVLDEPDFFIRKKVLVLLIQVFTNLFDQHL